MTGPGWRNGRCEVCGYVGLLNPAGECGTCDFPKYECPHCDERYSSLRNLLDHVRETHC